jgi:hypothetical protein
MAQTSLINNALILIVGILVGLIIARVFNLKIAEGFASQRDAHPSASKMREGFATQATCQNCGDIANVVCPPCKDVDMTKYVLKSTVPPCPAMPDLTKYMLKTECPPVPDLSQYVLKSSVPKQQPVILDCSKCQKAKGECPPCPRPRCPEIKCPEPTVCAPCAPCPRSECPATKMKCTAMEQPLQQVRPYLSPLDINIFGK